MIESPFIILEDGTRTLKAGEKVYEGSPVSLDANGQIVKADGTMKVFGVSKLDANDYRNFAFGEFGAFGTQKLTVVCKGIVRVAASVYNKIEIDTSSTAVSPVTVPLFDASLAYAPGDSLYVNAGLISNVAPVDGGNKSYLGKVVAPCAAGAQWLELEVAPLAAAAKL